MSHNNNRQADKGGSAETRAHFARQPIYDRDRAVFAYELLFREPEAATGADAPDRETDHSASARVLLDAITELDMEHVADNRLALINLSRDFLVDDHDLLPQDANMGIEIPATACNDDDAARVLGLLSARGITVALDDFSWQPGIERLLQQAHLVKIDIRNTDADALQPLAERLRDWPVKVLALNVETQEAFDQCRDMGFDYFQGFFLCRPRRVSTPRLPDSKINTLRLMDALQSPEVDPHDLEAIIHSDLTLHYRLLRTVNSSYYGLPVEVKSIAHAVIYLGIPTVRRWAYLQLVAGSDDRPPEVLRLALIRARMCEQLTPDADKEKRDTAFTVGLFSLLDGALDTSMELVLAHLPLDRDVARALVSREGPYGHLLQTVIWYEGGQWDRLEEDRRFALDSVTHCYLEALQWARAQFSALAG